MRAIFVKTTIVLGTSIVVGCASKPPVVVDNTPLVRAAMVTTKYSSTGFKGFMAQEGTQDSYTFPDKRRTNRTSKFTGSILSKIGGAQSTSDIIRMDKGVEWQVDNKAKQYQECAIGDCNGIGNFMSATFDAERQGEFESDAEADNELPPGCVITVTDQKFEVTKTGQQRDVNGFPAEEYQVDWRYNARDEEGGKLENLFKINIWTTPQTAEMTEALNVQDTFDASYSVALNDGYPDALTKALPRDGLALLERFFLDSLTDADLAKLKGMMANSPSIEGFPVSSKTKWDARNTTCAVEEEPEVEAKEDELNTDSLKGLLSSVSKKIVKQELDKKTAEKVREIELAPIFVYTVDVTAVKMADIHESQLSVPANYKLLTRR